MSSSSRVRLTRIRETAYGVLPTPGAMLRVRRTGGEFSDESTLNPSAEVRDDLMVTDVAREDYTAKGSIEDEWVYGAHDAELQDAFGAAPSATINLSGLSLTVVAAAGTYERAAGSWITDGLVVGGVYQFGGLTNAGNNGRKRITAITATVVTVAVLTGLVNEGPTASCTCKQGGHFRMGTTVYSSVFEELFPDAAADAYQQWLGSVCASWEWSFSHPGKMTTKFGYECAAGQQASATAGNGTVTDYAANRVMNSIDHFRALQEGGASAASLRVRDMSLNLSAPKRRILAAGTLGDVDKGANTFGLEGSIKVYNSVAARTVAAKAKANTLTSLEWETVDAAGNVYHFYAPALFYKSGSAAAGAKDSDVYITLPWLARLDTVTGSMLQVTRFPIA